MTEPNEEGRDITRMLSEARERPLPPPAVTSEHAEEWVESIRNDRDR